MEDVPNTLNSQLQVLLGWRSLEVGILYDLDKAYQHMNTTIKEKNLKRLVWRLRPGEAWKYFGYDCTNFGDKLALKLEKKRQRKREKKLTAWQQRSYLLTFTYVNNNCGECQGKM